MHLPAGKYLGGKKQFLPVFSLISHRTLKSAGFILWQFSPCFLFQYKTNTWYWNKFTDKSHHSNKSAESGVSGYFIISPRTCVQSYSSSKDWNKRLQYDWHQMTARNILALIFSHFLNNFSISLIYANWFKYNLFSNFFSFFFCINGGCIISTIMRLGTDNRVSGSEVNKAYK